MRIEEGLMPNQVEPVNRIVQSRTKPKSEITLEDLKLTEEKKNKEEAAELERTQLEATVEDANKLINISNYHMQFKIDEDSSRIQVKLIDNETQEIIREVPPETMLELSAHIKKVLDTVDKLVGVFVDEVG